MVMRVLVACEFSGEVRRAFESRGHDAWSCDLLEAEDGASKHFKGDVLLFLRTTWRSWDLVIAHPPCTHLAVSGARWWKGKKKEQAAAIQFVKDIMAVPVPRLVVENPISVLSTTIRKPDQIIQPWQHGHGETKATCLWLRGVPKLVPSKVVAGREARVHKMAPGEDRWKERSRTLPGVAKAMSEQWGSLSTEQVEV